MLIISISSGYLLAFSIGATKVGRIYRWNLLFTVGAILVLVRLMIRIGAILALRNQFTYTVTKIEEHKLVETGLYRYIRHPAYLGQLLIFIGIAVSMSNWLFVLAMIICISFGYFYRIKTEENFMVAQFGEKYVSYMKKTKKLIPGIY